MKNVLCLTGGGLFGYAQLCALMKSSSMHKIQIVAGTSAGAANALLIANRVDLSKAMMLYRDKAADIFHRPWWKLLPSAPKYDGKALTEVLKTILPNRFDQCSIPTFIPTHDLRYGVPKVFFSNTQHTMMSWEIARASMAAHTFFPPYEGRYADGGLFHNDPALATLDGIVENQLAHLCDIRMFSVGTGGCSTNREPPINPGLFEYLKIILGDTVDGGSVYEQRKSAANIIKHCKGKYEFFEFPASHMDFDDPAVIQMIDTHWKSEIADCARRIDAFFSV